MHTTTPLYIQLRKGRRVSSLFLRDAESRATQGIIAGHFKGRDAWDWYHVVWDCAPDVLHQVRRDALKPLKVEGRPLMGKLPAFVFQAMLLAA